MVMWNLQFEILYILSHIDNGKDRLQHQTCEPEKIEIWRFFIFCLKKPGDPAKNREKIEITRNMTNVSGKLLLLCINVFIKVLKSINLLLL